MKLICDDGHPSAASRLSGIRLSMFTLRFMETWRARVGDLDKTMILHAVAAIALERLVRAHVPTDLLDVRTPLPTELVARCNITSIAEATGFSRETTRRKVDDLIAENILVRLENGGIYFRPGAFQEDETLHTLHKQFEALTSLMNDLLKDGVVKLRMA